MCIIIIILPVHFPSTFSLSVAKICLCTSLPNNRGGRASVSTLSIRNNIFPLPNLTPTTAKEERERRFNNRGRRMIWFLEGA